jgi:NAD(P)-dependent dehydrogenase (short-subunit alcohol dehydrogenase family)
MFHKDLLKGKRILVTGGGSGLGQAMATRYLELGAEIYICGRRKSVLEESAKKMMDEHGGSVKSLSCDIKVPEAIEDMVDEIWSEGPLTGLLNNAAGNFISRTEDLSPRAFTAISNIVFNGTFYMTNAIGKRWLKENLKGSIISILTTWVDSSGPYTVPSAMSKSGLATMTRSLAAEWGNRGIRLNGIAPGPFPTKGAWDRLAPGGKGANMMEAIPMKRTGELSELANLATFLMADGCEYLTGEIIAIDGAQWLNHAGNFYEMLKDVTDDEWETLRNMIKSSNDSDKAKRSV